MNLLHLCGTALVKSINSKNASLCCFVSQYVHHVHTVLQTLGDSGIFITQGIEGIKILLLSVEVFIFMSMSRDPHHNGVVGH